MLDPEGLVVSWNSGAERTLGYSAGEILGKHFASFYAPEEIAADRPRLALEEAASKGQCVIEEAWRLRKGGVRFWAEVSTTALRGSEGGLRGFSKIIRDITERKQAEEELSSQMGEIARSNDELRQFAFCASHDLQEPLRKVETFGDRLKAKCGPLLTDEGRDYLERMQNAARRMKNLINHLLAYSRITTKAEPFVSVDLTKTTREVLSDLELLIEQSGARVELGDLPVIEADPTQMRQLLQNLLSNALKFQKPSEPPLVKVGGGILRGTKDSEEAPQGRLCQLTVEDNGIGFEPENANRIFTLFARLHGQSKYDGNGIGLAICRKIVERHKGTIVAKSVLGQGATFVVTLPVAQHPEPRER